MTILDFLASLATDTELMSAFRRDPEASMRARGLDEQARKLLLSGDPLALRRAVYAERATAGSPERPELTSVHPPPPHPGPEPSPEEWPGPPKPEEWPGAPKPELTSVHPPPPKPGPGPEPKPEVWPGTEKPEEWPTPAKPELVSVHPPAPKHSSNPEPLQAEPLDPERDLAQDAILAGLNSTRPLDQAPCGVWSTKGLTVVGTGMRAGLHMTLETRLALEQASRVLYLVADPVSEASIRKLNPNAESLWHLYQSGKQRIEIYETIIATILAELESAGDLCVAFYGHAGVLTYPAWESIRRARSMGKRARMLPAISTEDTLFADLGVDMGRAGLQSYEATRFMYYKYNFDTTAGLLLWQVSVLGETEWNPPHAGVRPRLEVLAEYLQRFYAPEHEVFLYHAPDLPTSRPLIERVILRDLPKAEFVSISTLYIPPQGQPDTNEDIMQALARIEAR